MTIFVLLGGLLTLGIAEAHPGHHTHGHHHADGCLHAHEHTAKLLAQSSVHKHPEISAVLDDLGGCERDGACMCERCCPFAAAPRNVPLVPVMMGVSARQPIAPAAQLHGGIVLILEERPPRTI